MKISLIYIFLLFTFLGEVNAQRITWKNIDSIVFMNDEDIINTEYKDSLRNFDFSPIWTHTTVHTYGIIGHNFQRLKIKLITIIRDTINKYIYHVYGKSMVRNNICCFRGAITITSIHIYKKIHYGPTQNKGIKKQGILIGEYNFFEDSTQSKSGMLKGSFVTLFYLGNNNIIGYDDEQDEADSYRNNQFAGIWKEYKTDLEKICNWGDFRIPFSGKLDIGAGFFSPDDKYLQFGWQNLRDAINGDEKAIKEELREWWK